MKRSKSYQPKFGMQAVQYKHDLGQHFLYDMELLRALVAKIGISDSDHVLEIGAGAGTLTRALCDTGARVTAVEVDSVLIPALQKMTGEYPRLAIKKSDIRKLDLKTLELGEGFIVVANIPYSITTQILDLFWGTGLPIRQMAVMVQKEVADKMTATPGDNAFGLMSVRCRYYCEPETVALVPAAAFTPPPKVDSAFVNLTFRTAPAADVLDEQLLWKLVKASYRQRRKTLQNALKGVLPYPAETLRDILSALGLPPTVRGETFSVQQWVEVTNAIVLTSRPSAASMPR